MRTAALYGAAHDVAGDMTVKAGFFDIFNNLSREAELAIQALAVVLAGFFVIAAGVRSKGGLGAILISLLAAGVFVWGVFNITTVKDSVDDTITDANVADG